MYYISENKDEGVPEAPAAEHISSSPPSHEIIQGCASRWDLPYWDSLLLSPLR